VGHYAKGIAGNDIPVFRFIDVFIGPAYGKGRAIKIFTQYLCIYVPTATDNEQR
jgi:hypothetical protein